MMMVAMLSAGFVACSDDDDDSSGSGVVGTWSGNDDGDRLTLTFKSNGSGTWTSRYYDSYSGTETERGTFTYEMDGKYEGVIYINEYDSYSGYSSGYYTFEIEGKKMYLYWRGRELEWTLTKN